MLIGFAPVTPFAEKKWMTISDTPHHKTAKYYALFFTYVTVRPKYPLVQRKLYVLIVFTQLSVICLQNNYD